MTRPNFLAMLEERNRSNEVDLDLCGGGFPTRC